MNTPDSNEIWIALISAASGLIAALGLNKVVPSILKWWEDSRERKRTLKEEEKNQLNNLLKRVDDLEAQVDKYKAFETRTDTAFKLMLPVISDVMRDHPHHIELFKQLQSIIFEEIDIPEK